MEEGAGRDTAAGVINWLRDPKYTPPSAAGMLVFLQRRDDQIPISEFEGHDDVRVRFHGRIAFLAGYDVDTISGAPAIIIKRAASGAPSPKLGDWTGIGDYTRDVQDVLDQLLPCTRDMLDDAFVYTAVYRDHHGRCDTEISTRELGQSIKAVGATAARALLMAWLKWRARAE